jgi:Membrane bound FAD containing D-sorbitol dehydrogenase
VAGQFQLTRRRLLWLSSSCLAAACAGSHQRRDSAASIDLNCFMQISRVLTEANGLSDEAGRQYLAAILGNTVEARALSELWQVGAFDGPESSRSVADLVTRGVYDVPELARLADAITRDWYSGVYVTATGEQRVATYDNALAWGALGYGAGGRSACGGVFGHWASKPLGA